MPKYKIAVGLTSGNCMVNWILPVSLFNMMSERDMSDWHFRVLAKDSIYIDLNRCNIVYNFLQTDCEFLWFIDHDNGWKFEDLEYFMEDFKDPSVNIVSGQYWIKDGSMVLCAGKIPPWQNEDICEWFPATATFPDGRLYNVTQEFGVGDAVVGAGMLMIRRRVFEEMKFPWYQSGWIKGASDPIYEHRTVEGMFYLGEDNYFSKKAQEHGFDIHLDSRIKSPHLSGNASHPPEWHPFDEKQQAVSGVRIHAKEVSIEELLEYREDNKPLFKFALGKREDEDDAT
jgi:hypothetical protein